MPSTDQAVLLQLARASIAHGLEHGEALGVDPLDYPESLREPRGCFVSLHRGRDLRGCIGCLQPRATLVEDVARCAWSAASADPRMQPVTADELPDLNLSISVLTPPAPLEVASEEDLLATVRPGVDGLTAIEGTRCGTLLPVVWQSLPDPRAFIRTVKQKAGLPANYWSDSLRWERYEAEEFGE